MRMVIGWAVFLFSEFAAAGWVQVPTEYGGRMYYDIEGRVRSGNIVSMTSLSDYDSPSTTKANDGKRKVMVQYISMTNDMEFDCVKRQYRNIGKKYFQSSMGKGFGYLDNHLPTDWAPLPTTASWFRQAFDAACK